jgi:hypothetical protein
MRKWRWTYTPKLFNWVCFILGMSMVWHLSQDWQLLAWTFVASIHVTFGIKPATREGREG